MCVYNLHPAKMTCRSRPLPEVPFFGECAAAGSQSTVQVRKRITGRDTEPAILGLENASKQFMDENLHTYIFFARRPASKVDW